MFSIKVYLAIAALIALAAFGIGQILPGMGVPFVALASTLWTAYAVRRGQRLGRPL